MEIRENDTIDTRFYRVPSMRLWRGRDDGNEPSQRRWHQHVQLFDLTGPTTEELRNESAIAILGFACDEGIKRNQGRIGAARGPEAIRKALSTLPIFHPDLSIYDTGDIYCPGGELEIAQQQLALAVVKILRRGAFPIVLGGGHEITYGHYCGIYAFLRHQQEAGPGVINFDAHFDNREVTANGPTSGTGFWQIETDCKRNGEEFRYLALGIQKTSNTPHLFETAHRTDTRYALATQFDGHHRDQPADLVERFSRTNEWLYVTVDLDVFAAPYAPGVSAPAYNGIRPDTLFFNCLEKVFATGKLVSLDIAELNPAMDIDGRTAKLAAAIIFYAVNYLSETRR